MDRADGATIHLNRFEEWEAARSCRERAEDAARAALEAGCPGTIREEGASGRDRDAADRDQEPAGRPPGCAEVSITCVSVDEIRAMNRRYLSRDGPTDVIAFELGERDRLLGDVYLSPEVADGQAAERGIDPAREVLRLVIHGVLHVAGWDHPGDEGREESEMYRLQEAILAEVAGP